MVKVVLIILIYVFSEKTFASQLARNLERILTIAEESMVKVPRHSLQSRLNALHWRRVEHKEDDNGGGRRAFTVNLPGPLHSLYEELASKIKKTGGLEVENSLQLPSPDEFEEKEFLSAGTKFVDGHYATIREKDGELEYPFVGISVFSRNTAASHSKKKDQFWFIPIEQVFTFQTFRDYRRGVALLKYWEIYDSAVLCYIPQGTKVNMHMGQVAPQQWPLVEEQLYSHHVLHLNSGLRESLELTARLGKISLEEAYRAFRENMDGGAFQYFIGSTREGYLYPLNLFKNSKKRFVSKYAVNKSIVDIFTGESKKYDGEDHDVLRETLVYPAWIPQNGENFHFMDVSYDSNPLQLPQALEDLKLIEGPEREKIEKIIEDERA